MCVCVAFALRLRCLRCVLLRNTNADLIHIAFALRMRCVAWTLRRPCVGLACLRRKMNMFIFFNTTQGLRKVHASSDQSEHRLRFHASAIFRYISGLSLFEAPPGE
jgi:hypothetical protein